jgi:hypothetical protein
MLWVHRMLPSNETQRTPPNVDFNGPGATNTHRTQPAHEPIDEPGAMDRGTSLLQAHPMAVAAALVGAGTVLGVLARGFFVRRQSAGEVLGDAVERQVRALLHGVRLVRRMTGSQSS